MIENEQEFRDWCRKNGLKEKPVKNYISWLNMASRRINEDITPSSLSSEDDVDRMIAVLNTHPDMLEIHGRRPQDTKAAMRMYVRMCRSNVDPREMLRPYLKPNLMDLLIDAGIDVSSWSDFAGGQDRAASNPTYCYKWSFLEPGNVIVLSLWFEDLKFDDGIIYQDRNIRQIGQGLQGPSKRRAFEMDCDIKAAWQTGISVRVIVCDRNPENPSRATKRILDPLVWGVKSYDETSGECRLERGYLSFPFVDQFSMQEAQDHQVMRRDCNGTVFERNADVKRRVLVRAQGKCEYCGEEGFRTAGRQIYLESHHIIPLSEFGPDNESNIAALCPNHHREAHYGFSKEEIKIELLKKIQCL